MRTPILRTKVICHLALALAALVAIDGITPLAAQATRVRLTGTVRDSLGVPIAAAEVALDERRARTDDSGRFEFPATAVGPVTVSARRIGFMPARLDTTLVAPRRAPMVVNVVLVLMPLPADLDPVEALAASNRRLGKLSQFEERRARGFGSFITRAEIIDRRPAYLSDMLRSVPGMLIMGSGMGGYAVRVARTGRGRDCHPDYYIDGIPAPGFELDLMPPQDVDGIEIYRGASTVPAAFRQRTAGCGVIAIWTYDPGDPHEDEW